MAWILTAFGVALVYTLVVMREYGVTMKNHRVFVELWRMKRRGATTDEMGSVLYGYVIDAMNRNGSNAIDMAPLDMFDEHDAEEIVTVVISELLDNGIKPVSIDRSERHTIMHVGRKS